MNGFRSVRFKTDISITSNANYSFFNANKKIILYPSTKQKIRSIKSTRQKGRRNIGRPRKRWRDQLHLEDQGTGNTPNPSGT